MRACPRGLASQYKKLAYDKHRIQILPQDKSDMSQTITRYREDAGTRAESRSRSRVRLLRWVLMAGGVAVVLVGGLLYWLDTGRWVSTSDAYVEANVETVSTDVSGIVDSIPVHEGEHVQKGQVLFRLDPQKFQYALQNAQANLAQTRLSLEAMKSNYQAAVATVAGKRAQVKDDAITYQRLAALARTSASTKQQVDDALYRLQGDQEALNAAQAQAKSILAKLGGNVDAPVDQMPAYRQAQSQVDEAQRQLNHAIVRAPYAGVVTQVNKLQPGMFLAAGTPGFGFVGTNQVWVQAEPKETALTYARPGDKATVTVDAYPGRTFTGTVQSIAAATDQQFSLLPAQNSSGNWVKVVQRVPVRVNIDVPKGGPALSAGMSATVSIDTGHTRSLSDLF